MLDAINFARGFHPQKLGLPFLAIAFGVGAAAFMVGYRGAQPSASSIRTVAATPEQANPADTARDPADFSSTTGAQRDGLQVIGFAKVGFAQMEELLTSSTPQERERWAQELAALPEQAMKSLALVAFYIAWLDHHPDEALRSLRDFPDPLSRMRLFASIESAVPPAILPQLVGIVAEFSEAERRFLLPSFLAALSQTDPVAAARFIDSHPQLVSSSEAAALISAWAADDIAAAAHWLEGSRFAGEPETLRTLVDRWLAKDPAAAQSYVLRHQQTAGMEEAAASVASHLLTTSPAQAREFISMFDPERALSVVATMISSEDNNRIGDLTEWASTLPASVRDTGVMGYALGIWNRVDPPAALAWLQAQPAAERESLVVQMIHNHPVPSPELIALAYTIRDVQERDRALTSLIRSLPDPIGDPVEQIRALGLPADQMNHLLGLRAAPEE